MEQPPKVEVIPVIPSPCHEIAPGLGASSDAASSPGVALPTDGGDFWLPAVENQPELPIYPGLLSAPDTSTLFGDVAAGHWAVPVAQDEMYGDRLGQYDVDMVFGLGQHQNDPWICDISDYDAFSLIVAVPQTNIPTSTLEANVDSSLHLMAGSLSATPRSMLTKERDAGSRATSDIDDDDDEHDERHKAQSGRHHRKDDRPPDQGSSGSRCSHHGGNGGYHNLTLGSWRSGDNSMCQRYESYDERMYKLYDDEYMNFREMDLAEVLGNLSLCNG